MLLLGGISWSVHQKIEFLAISNQNRQMVFVTTPKITDQKIPKIKFISALNHRALNIVDFLSKGKLSHIRTRYNYGTSGWYRA